MIMQQIYHKKNEIFEIEFFKDKECTQDFDFTNARNLYIDGLNGDVTPLTAISDEIRRNANIHTPYIPQNQKPLPDNIKTLDDITPNLSKYIPEDNAVLFLSEDGYKRHKDCFMKNYIDNFFKKLGFLREGRYDTIYSIRPFVYDKDLDFGLKKPHPKTRDVCWGIRQTNKLTIFLHHGTQSEIQKADEVGKYLWENFGIKPNLCVLHCFVNIFITSPKNNLIIQDRIGNTILGKPFANEIHFNKIITTNSTGILPVQDNERLQVINCFEIFEEYLNGNN